MTRPVLLTSERSNAKVWRARVRPVHRITPRLRGVPPGGVTSTSAAWALALGPNTSTSTRGGGPVAATLRSTESLAAVTGLGVEKPSPGSSQGKKLDGLIGKSKYRMSLSPLELGRVSRFRFSWLASRCGCTAPPAAAGWAMRRPARPEALQVMK